MNWLEVLEDDFTPCRYWMEEDLGDGFCNKVYEYCFCHANEDSCLCHLNMEEEEQS